MKMSSEYDCGNEDNPQNSVNLMNIVGEYPAKYTSPVVKFLITKSQFLQYNLILALNAAAVAAPRECIGPRIGDVFLHFLSAFFFATTLT